MECFIMSGNKTTFTKDKLWISSLGILCAVCLMIVFLITAIEAVVYWTPGYFEAEYTKYQVLEHLPPMTMEDLLIVTDEMMAYLRGNRADLHVFTNLGGLHMEFFNAREIAHMEDVRGLFIGGLMLRKIGLAFTAAYAVLLSFWCKKDQERKNLLKTVVPGSLFFGTCLFFAVTIFIAATIASDFSKYFVVFHHIFFDNDLWILNPATDLLINIVPEPFFMDTALRIGITFGLMVVAFLAISFYLWKRSKKTLK